MFSNLTTKLCNELATQLSVYHLLVPNIFWHFCEIISHLSAISQPAAAPVTEIKYWIKFNNCHSSIQRTNVWLDWLETDYIEIIKTNNYNTINREIDLAIHSSALCAQWFRMEYRLENSRGKKTNFLFCLAVMAWNSFTTPICCWDQENRGLLCQAELNKLMGHT